MDITTGNDVMTMAPEEGTTVDLGIDGDTEVMTKGLTAIDRALEGTTIDHHVTDRVSEVMTMDLLVIDRVTKAMMMVPLEDLAVDGVIGTLTVFDCCKFYTLIVSQNKNNIKFCHKSLLPRFLDHLTLYFISSSFVNCKTMKAKTIDF